MGIWDKLSKFISHKITFWAVVVTAIADVIFTGVNQHWVSFGLLCGSLIAWVWLGRAHWWNLMKRIKA